MKKERKLLRKLLADYREKLAKMTYTKERANLVDCATILIEALK